MEALKYHHHAMRAEEVASVAGLLRVHQLADVYELFTNIYPVSGDGIARLKLNQRIAREKRDHLKEDRS